MKLDNLFETHQHTKTVFQRKNGALKILKIPLAKLETATPQTQPMFPIVKDRDASTN